MALRYFNKEYPELHLIAASSLLEFAFQDISFPVGRLQLLVMHPMTFEEFLIAIGKELLAEKIKQPNNELSDAVIKMANNEMYKYFVVGGMPECVSAFVITRSFLETINIQTDLMATLRQDFSKYAGHSDKRCLNSVLTSVARKTGDQIKYSHLAENYTNPTIKKAFDLLETARLFTKVRAASPAGIPLGASASKKKFKTVFLDIGLVSNLCGFYSDKTIPKKRLAAAYNGKLAEQFVGQELRLSSAESLYYWSRDARGSSVETDYLVDRQPAGRSGQISETSGKLASRMRQDQ